MSSPAKKRKLNNGSKKAAAPTKGLEYFFNKQKQDASAAATPQPEASTRPDSELTDEELARKLQDEWNQEEVHQGTDERVVVPPDPDVNGNDETSEVKERSKDQRKDQRNSETLASEGKVFEPNGKKTLTLQSAGATEDSVTAAMPFDESPLTFDPSKYVAELQSAWKSEGGDATYALLTRCFVLVSSTQSRIKIVDTLVNCLRVLIEVDPSSLLPAVRKRGFHVSHMLIETGLAGHKRHLAPIYIARARFRRFCNLKGAQTSLWAGQQIAQSHLRQVWGCRRCRL